MYLYTVLSCLAPLLRAAGSEVCVCLCARCTVVPNLTPGSCSVRALGVCVHTMLSCPFPLLAATGFGQCVYACVCHAVLLSLAMGLCVCVCLAVVPSPTPRSPRARGHLVAPYCPRFPSNDYGHPNIRVVSSASTYVLFDNDYIIFIPFLCISF